MIIPRCLFYGPTLSMKFNIELQNVELGSLRRNLTFTLTDLPSSCEERIIWVEIEPYFERSGEGKIAGYAQWDFPSVTKVYNNSKMNF